MSRTGADKPVNLCEGCTGVCKNNMNNCPKPEHWNAEFCEECGQLFDYGTLPEELIMGSWTGDGYHEPREFDAEGFICPNCGHVNKF